MIAVDPELVAIHNIKPGEIVGTCEICGCLLNLADNGESVAAPHGCHAEAKRRARTTKIRHEMEADAAYSPEIMNNFGARLAAGSSMLSNDFASNYSSLDGDLEPFYAERSPERSDKSEDYVLASEDEEVPEATEATEAQEKKWRESLSLYKKRAQVARETGLCPKCGRPIAFDISPIAERKTQGGVCYKCGFKLWPRGPLP